MTPRGWLAPIIAATLILVCGPAQAKDLEAYLLKHKNDGQERTYQVGEKQLRAAITSGQIKDPGTYPSKFDATSNSDGTVELVSSEAHFHCRLYLNSASKKETRARIVCFASLFGGSWEKILLNTISDNVAKSLTAATAPEATGTLAQCDLRQDLEDREAAETASFDAALANGPVTTGLSEEAHAFEVKAKWAVKQEDFKKAADFYAKGLASAPGWPEGRFNYALILAKNACYPEAIREMKRYLKIAPKAPDARKAKDKIYEWEAASE